MRRGRGVDAGWGGVALPVRRADGTGAYLKMSMPTGVRGHESDVLASCAGHGAVHLCERDDDLGGKTRDLHDRVATVLAD